jgi:hypothetical protein
MFQPDAIVRGVARRDATRRSRGAATPASTTGQTTGRPLVGHLMTPPHPIVPKHISMGAARKVAWLKKADALLVEDGGSLAGFIDSRVLLTAKDDERVADCLQPLGFCLSPTTTVARARELLTEHGALSFLVAAGGFLLGSISRASVERSLAGSVPASGRRSPGPAAGRRGRSAQALRMPQPWLPCHPAETGSSSTPRAVTRESHHALRKLSGGDPCF